MSWTRLCLVGGLVLLGLGTVACSFVGNARCGYTTARTPCEAASDFGVGLGLVPPDCCGPCGARSPLGMEYASKLNDARDFMSLYAFNYDVNDPYRGKDAQHMGEFLGVYALNYNVHAPCSGDCVVGW